MPGLTAVVSGTPLNLRQNRSGPNANMVRFHAFSFRHLKPSFSPWFCLVTRDGQFNPDQRLVNNAGDFSALADAVFYGALAWRITNSSTYSSKVASFVKTWFVDNSTSMNPNRTCISLFSVMCSFYWLYGPQYSKFCATASWTRRTERPTHRRSWP